MTVGGPASALLLALLLAACAGPGPRPAAPAASSGEPAGTVEPAPGPALSLTPVRFADLPGWPGADRITAALPALLKSCRRLDGLADHEAAGRAAVGGPAGAWRAACTALSARPPGPQALRWILEQHFRPWRVAGPTGSRGLFTGYYLPEIAAAEDRRPGYTVPIHGAPPDLVRLDPADFDPARPSRIAVGHVVGGRVQPLPPRRAIADGVLMGRAPVLAWAADRTDLFFMQIQGSGLIRLPDGRRRLLGFAAHNGHAYRSIGRILIREGAIPAEVMSMQRLRAWLADHPERRPNLLARNPRYVFFRRLPGRAPRGAAGVSLTAGRSLAVDSDLLPLGAPMWLDTTGPAADPGRIRRLVVAQDTGGAITGAVRGDLYFGSGPKAARRAGSLRGRGGYWLLLPRGLTPERESGRS